MLLTSVEQLDGVIAAFRQKPEVSLDLETTGLRPAEGDQICMVGLYHPELGAYSASFRMHGFAPNLPVKSLQLLQPLVDNCRLVGHYVGPFDLNCLRAEGLDVSKAQVWTHYPWRKSVV